MGIALTLSANGVGGRVVSQFAVAVAVAGEMGRRRTGASISGVTAETSEQACPYRALRRPRCSSLLYPAVPCCPGHLARSLARCPKFRLGVQTSK